MNNHQKIAVIIMDVLLIMELCISMYVASKNPDLLTSIFLKYFFIMAIPTFIIAKVFIKRLQSKPL